MRFVFEPLLATESEHTARHDAWATISAERELRSPWLHLTLSRSPKLFMRATFFWSERQMLLDQALFAGGRVREGEPLAPLKQNSFAAMEAVYRRSPTSGDAAPDRIVDDIPADVFWLLQQLPPKTGDHPPSTAAERQVVIDRASSKQVIFTHGLFDRVFNTNIAFQEIHSVFDVIER